MPIDSPSAEDITDLLPLPLLRSQIVPPAPNRRKSAIDFIPDFGGSSWIAYGASSLLVISHFPSPLNDSETLIGPSFQQVIDPTASPSCSPAGDVVAVRWSRARPSDGEIAAAVGDCVFLFCPDSATAAGSFCWRQTAGLLQSSIVEAIEWTGSGDGLIAAGTDVVVWQRKNTSWEIAWKSRADIPQALVSATWYAEGLIATAANLSVHCTDINSNCSFYREDCARVSVYHSDGRSGSVKVLLCHPQPVTMIQWRPSTITRSSKDFPNSWRDVLLTCCSDGTVRLWSEIDNGRTRKFSKDANEHKSARRSFHVVTVIEMNQSLGGTLGKDIFIEWVIELGSVISKFEGDSYCLSSASLEQDQIGKCEWLISVGPMHTLTFWAIHCLDDMNPLRFPRVTLWKKQDLKDFRSYNLSDTYCSNVKDQSILIKAVALRNRMFGPPVECSFVQLLPNNSVSWSQLYSPTRSSENRSLSQISKEKSLSHFAGGVLNQDGHTGIILELSIHPYCEIELAASLDSHGFLLFWSLPTISNCTLGMQMLGHPTWKLIGRISSQDLSNGVKYSSMRWAPSVLDDNLFLLLGYTDGIDCFLIKLVENGKKILCNKVFSVPFASHSHGEGPPDQLSVVPLPSSCGQSFLSNSFLLFAIWTNKLQASSWKVILHCADPSGSSCGCSSVPGNIAISEKDRFITSAGTFYATVDLGSSLFPAEHNLDHIISISVTSPDMLSVQQRIASYDVPSSKYHMATGCSDGTVKLWKMVHAESSNSELKFLPWELVGIFAAHEGPVSAVSLSCCGGKVATVSMNDRNSTTSVHIWEPICLISGGSFLLEDAISLIGPVTGLSWLSIGNGHLLLAVCLPNELHLYSEKRSDLFQEKSGKSREMQIWCCIALSHTYPASRDFSWGPKVTPVLIHDKYFSLLSQWLFIAENGSLQEENGKFVGAMDQNMNFPIFSESDIYDTKISLKKGNKENGVDISTLFPERFQARSNFGFASGIRVHNLLDLADRLCETLPIHHPISLLQLMYSGILCLQIIIGLIHFVSWLPSVTCCNLLFMDLWWKGEKKFHFFESCEYAFAFAFFRGVFLAT